MIYNITKFFNILFRFLTAIKIYKETGVERRVGSSPTSPTNIKIFGEW